MKKIYYLFLIGIVLNSCQKQLNYDLPTVPNSGTGTTTGGTTSSTDCKACAYLPVCDGARFTYADTLYSTASIVTDTFQFVKDTLIDNKSFRKIYSPVSKAATYYNCTDGATRLIGYNNTTAAGNSITVADITFLKANLPVGGTWQDQLANPAGQQVIYKDSIVSKGGSRSINGQVFSDVIHVTVQTGINVPGLGYTVVTITDYYFGKGVGLLETFITEPSSGLVFQHRAIKSYFIP